MTKARHEPNVETVRELVLRLLAEKPIDKDVVQVFHFLLTQFLERILLQFAGSLLDTTTCWSRHDVDVNAAAATATDTAIRWSSKERSDAESSFQRIECNT